MRYLGTSPKDTPQEFLMEELKRLRRIGLVEEKVFQEVAYSFLSKGGLSDFFLNLEVEHVKFDDIFRKEIESLASKRNSRDSNEELSTGDFIRTSTGTLLRVTVDHSLDSFQASEGGSFHLSKDGGMSFSGTCGDLFNKSDFELSDEESLGSFWFWHPDKGPGGGNGVYAKAMFRVFKEIKK